MSLSYWLFLDSAKILLLTAVLAVFYFPFAISLILHFCWEGILYFFNPFILQIDLWSLECLILALNENNIENNDDNNSEIISF